MRLKTIVVLMALGVGGVLISGSHGQTKASPAAASPWIDFARDLGVRESREIGSGFEFALEKSSALNPSTTMSLTDGTELTALSALSGRSIQVWRDRQTVAEFDLPQSRSQAKALRFVEHPRNAKKVLLFVLLSARARRAFPAARDVLVAESLDGGRHWRVRAPFYLDANPYPQGIPIAWLDLGRAGTRLICESGKTWTQIDDGPWKSESLRELEGIKLLDALVLSDRRLAIFFCKPIYERARIIITADGGKSFGRRIPLPDELCGRHQCFARGSSTELLGITFVEDRESVPTCGDLKLWVGSLANLLDGTSGHYIASIARSTPLYAPRPPFSAIDALRVDTAWRVRAHRWKASPDQPAGLFKVTISDAVAKARIPRLAPTLPLIDLNDEEGLHTVVDREKGQYLGHVTTCLLEDGKSIIAVYPKGHGKGPIVMKRSADGGRTWSERLPTPENWATSREVPTIHPVIDPKTGARSLILWSGLYPARIARSEDEGATWSPLEPVGDWGGIVVMGSVEALKDGRLLALFHDDGRFRRAKGSRTNPPKFRVFAVRSRDAGRTWGRPTIVLEDTHLQPCEPGLIRSPDGKTLAVLLRENSRQANSLVIFSEDEGETWSAPRQLPADLTGDRHTLRYADDGRLLVSFRDMALKSPTRGDWMAWVGTFENILTGSPGQYRVRIKDNQNSWDSTYPGVERLSDGTFVLTTYGHWDKGESPYILSVRLNLDELDEKLKAQSAK